MDTSGKMWQMLAFELKITASRFVGVLWWCADFQILPEPRRLNVNAHPRGPYVLVWGAGSLSLASWIQGSLHPGPRKDWGEWAEDVALQRSDAVFEETAHGSSV